MTARTTNSVPHDRDWGGQDYQQRPNVTPLRPASSVPTVFELRDANEVDAETKQLTWVIEGLLQAGVNMLFGASGAGKSFVVTDIAMHIATGQPWRGLPTISGTVVYIAAEDPEGLSIRRNGWRFYYGTTPNAGRLILIERPVRLNNEADVAGVIAQLHKKAITPTLIIFDTLARCLPNGDENDNGQMGGAIDAIERILSETGATAAVVVHHKGHATATRARGASALPAAMQGIIQVTGGVDEGVMLTVDKERNGKPINPISLSFQEVFPSEGVSTLVVARPGGTSIPPTARRSRAARQPKESTRIRRTDVLNVLKRSRQAAGPKEIAEKLGKPTARKAVYGHLTGLVEESKAIRVGEGLYRAR